MRLLKNSVNVLIVIALLFFLALVIGAIIETSQSFAAEKPIKTLYPCDCCGRYLPEDRLLSCQCGARICPKCYELYGCPGKHFTQTGAREE